jgi:hypothetical protein
MTAHLRVESVPIIPWNRCPSSRGTRTLLGDGDVIAIDGKALRGARDKGQSARTRMMVSAAFVDVRSEPLVHEREKRFWRAADMRFPTYHNRKSPRFSEGLVKR